jgi:hypothetical protein
MDDLCLWMPFSPYRVPEWRWRRAAQLHQTGRRIERRVDDEWVRHARDALHGRGRTGTPAAAVQAAREVWVGDPDRRGEIEARLLAGDTDAAIADQRALPELVVAAYALVYFDVRPAVASGASDWVLAQAVGYSPFGGFTAPLPWASWRLAAVAGGPLFADVVIAATTGRPLPPAFSGPGGADEVRVREFARLWVAAMAAVTPAAFAPVIREYRRVRTADSRRHGGKVRVEPMVLAMESYLLSRAVVGMKGDASVAAEHSLRDDPIVVTASSAGRTCGTGGERAREKQQARPPLAEPSDRSTRRTHAA